MNKMAEQLNEIIKCLEDISKNNYTNFEIALLIFLRNDREILKSMTALEFEQLKELVENCISILDINKEDVDYILDDIPKF